MSDLGLHLMLCDPQPDGAASTKRWKKAVQGVAQIILDSDQSTPWEMAEIVARIAAEGRRESDGFGTKFTAVIARALPDSSGRHDLFSRTCVMSAAIHVLQNRRLRSELTLSRRDSIAVALWSALSFQKPLTEERLEEVRAEILRKSRCTGLELARQSRMRRISANSASPDVENGALRWNTSLDQEEIEVLRWTLADESNLLGRPYSDVERDESFALARGLDLGLLLTKFPTFEHYELASRDVTREHKIDLGELVDAVNEDRNALLTLLDGNLITEACPATFPLLTALRTGSPRHADSVVRRSLKDWCGRALLESAIVQHSKRDAEGN